MVLAGGEASRLYKALVRDLRLAKDVSAGSDTKEIAGLFTLQATAAEGKSTAEIEKVFAGEIARLKAEPPSPAELARGLARHETAAYSRLTRSIGRAITIGTGYAQHDDPEHYRKEFARYFKVTPDDIRRVAAKYLTDAKVAVLVRPVKPGEAKAESVPVGPEPSSSSARRRPDHAPAGPGTRLVEAARSREPDALPPARLRPEDARQRDRRSGSLPGRRCRSCMSPSESPVGTGDDPEGKSGLASLTAAAARPGDEDRRRPPSWPRSSRSSARASAWPRGPMTSASVPRSWRGTSSRP